MSQSLTACVESYLRNGNSLADIKTLASLHLSPVTAEDIMSAIILNNASLVQGLLVLYQDDTPNNSAFPRFFDLAVQTGNTILLQMLYDACPPIIEPTVDMYMWALDAKPQSACVDVLDWIRTHYKLVPPPKFCTSAVMRGYVDVLQWMQTHAFPLEWTCSESETSDLFHVVIVNNHVEMLKWLHFHQAEISGLTQFPQQVFFSAMATEKWDILRFLVIHRQEKWTSQQLTLWTYFPSATHHKAEAAEIRRYMETHHAQRCEDV